MIQGCVQGVPFKRLLFQPKVTDLHFRNFWLKLTDLTCNICAFNKLLLNLDFWKVWIVWKQEDFNEKAPYFIFQVTSACCQYRWLAQSVVLPHWMKYLFKSYLKLSNAHMSWVEILILSQKSWKLCFLANGWNSVLLSGTPCIFEVSVQSRATFV